MNFSFVFKLYFSSTFYYVHCSTTNFYSVTHPSDVQVGGCPAFLQERIQKNKPRAGKKACEILGGRAQKDVFPFTREKNGGRVQKIEK